MPKMKSNRGAHKRFRVTASGKIKNQRAYASHLLSKKSAKRKRHLHRSTYVSSVDTSRVHRMILQ